MVVGDKLEDGREVTQGNKYKTAQQKGTTIYNEDQFEQFIRDKSGNPNFQFSMRKQGLLDMIPEASVVKEIEKKEVGSSEMWTEKYKPKSIYDLVGNSAVVD